MSLAVVCALALVGREMPAAEKPLRLTFQECSVICIQDSPARHPKALFRNPDGEAPEGPAAFASSINVFLVEKDGRRILVDAGNAPERGKLHAQLEHLGIDPADIHAVVITHIHPDHVGGLLWEGTALFPNATLCIARLEYESWQKDSSRAALARCLAPYRTRMNLFEYGDALPGGLRPEKKAGHTPGHTVYRLRLSAQEEGVFAGDILHSVELQVPHPEFCARYDANPKEAITSRRELLGERGVLLFGAHFPFPGCAAIKDGVYTPRSR